MHPSPLPPLLHTARLVLQPLEPAHVKPLAAIFKDPKVRQWMPTMASISSEHDFELQVRGSACTMTWAVLCEPSQPVGKFTLSRDSGEISYWLGHDFWGRGYASELLGAVLSWNDKSPIAPRIIAHVLRDNNRSIKLLLKQGFRFDGLQSFRLPCGRGTCTAARFVRPAH